MRAGCFLAVSSLLHTSAAAGDAAATSARTNLADLPLESLVELEVQTVYGASKYEQKTTAAPSSVTVITAEEIKRYGYRTLADILNSVQGFYISYDRNHAFLGSRGLNLGDYNSRILLLINGHRLNNDLTDGAYIDTAFALDVDLIDRVEIIRGPGSVLYGNNAFFGVINVITRQANQVGGREISGQYGENATYRGRLTYGEVFTNGLQLMLSGTVGGSAGAGKLFYPQFNTPAHNNGIAQGLDDDSYSSFFGSSSYRDFTAEGVFVTRNKQNPTAQYLTTFDDPRLRTLDDRSYASLKYTHNFPDFVEVTAQAHYDRSDFEIGYPQSFLIGSKIISQYSKEVDASESWGAELQLNKRLWEQHIITLGAEFRDDFRQHRSLFDPDTGQVFTDTTDSRKVYGVYLQGDFAVLANLHFDGGMRYDLVRDDQRGDVQRFSPRLAWIYNPCEQSTLKAIYGTAFRAPNFLELSDPRFQDVKPETIDSVELVYEQGIGRNLRSSVSGFYDRMNDLILFQNGNYTNYDAQTEGIELALEGTWTNGIRTRLSYSLQQTKNRTIGGGLPDSPHHLGKFNVSVPVYKQKVFAGLEFQYTSSRHTVYTSSDGSTTRPGADAPGFGIVNFTLFSRNLVKNFEFSGSVYNLFDRRYGDPATPFHQQDIIIQDGRSFRLDLTYHF